MADKKISQLTTATTPLDGTEVLPIVQSGDTKKVTNNDLRPKQIQSNTTSGVLQVAGPAAGVTRVMTTPDADFTVLTTGNIGSTVQAYDADTAKLDVNQTWTGSQTFNGGVVLNQAGVDVDFRVESSVIDDSLFVDGGTGRVGVGTKAPSSQFSIGNGGTQLLHHVYADQNFGALNTWYRVARLLRAGSSSGYVGEIEFGCGHEYGTTGSASGDLRISLTGRFDSINQRNAFMSWGVNNAAYCINQVRIATEGGQYYFEIKSNSSVANTRLINAYIRGTYFVPLNLEDASGSTPVQTYDIGISAPGQSGSGYLFSTGGNIRFERRDVPIGSINANGFAPAAGKGIDFSADGSAAGMTSELLDDYEEGTFTPTLTTSSVDFTSVTYDGFTGGRYVKVGNKVTVYGTLRTDAVSIGSASGAVSIGNLPFVAADNTGSTRDGASAVAVSDTTGWAVNHPSTGQTLGGTALLLLYYRATVNGAASVLTATDVATGANANRIAFCATYLTA